MPEIPKAYEPQAVEARWYQYWLQHQFFVADPARVSPRRPAYSIVIPPPNVTGVLHMGHVLNNTIQDILARKARMDGKEVLWLPGTDHAGIGTEVMVEKDLAKEKLTKRDLGREKFVERVWQWKEKHGNIIIEQLKKLGASCDWSRERFTMDPEYVRCVQRVFVDLYQKGLIYRGKRMVNWCPASLTALSDEEVEMVPQKGTLWYFRIEVAEEPGTFLTIATTRPETIPGDTAVAVNPKDTRYARLIGRHAIRPLPAELSREQKLIPIIADEQIDPEFGTGVLKVTPAHDKADFEIGRRHGLPAIDIMNPNATMNAAAGASLAGLDRFAARLKAVEQLKDLGALVKEEPYENKVGFSQRANVPIEPRLSEQWFLKYPSVEKARACVEQEERSAEHPLGPREADAPRSEKMRFHPHRWAKVYDHWMANIQDWCISRQLWWGHRIPVWYAKSAGGRQTTEAAGQSSSIQHPASSIYVGVEPPSDSAHWEQDPDVLDTWYSSWLWPFATMGWPERTPTLKAFYPTNDLVTAPEIIFFWVARMIMAGYEYMGEPQYGLAEALPFRNVYFTGIVRDKQGRKMSKSLGNSPDALGLIAKYGADAVRFGTMRSAPLGQDVLFDEKDVELGRNFCNKLWNACRFRQMQGGVVQGEIDPNRLRSDDKWILLKLHQAIEELDAAFANYKFNEATATLYRFFWSEYCDWYVESAKAVLTRSVELLNRLSVEAAPPSPGQRGRAGEGREEGNPSTLQPLNASTNSPDARRANVLAVMDFVLSHTLRLFHPFLPFITEELWHAMGYAEDMPDRQGGQTIMFAPWPKPFDADFRDHYSLDDCYLDFVNAKYELVSQGRNLRREANLPANKRVSFVLKREEGLAPGDTEVIQLLLQAESLQVQPDYQPAKGTVTCHTPLGELYLPLEGLVDAAAEKTRLTKELEKIRSEISKVEQKLANPNFLQKVPPEVLAEHRRRLEDWQAKRAHVEKALANLGSG